MAPIKVRKNGAKGWPWTVWCAFCNEYNDEGINTAVGWRWWESAFRKAFEHAKTHDDRPKCPTCGKLAEIPGEGRFCGSCQDFEGHCAEDHCMTCGGDT